MKRKAQIKEGNVLLIQLPDLNKSVVGRMCSDNGIQIYDRVYDDSEIDFINIDDVVKNNVLFYCLLYTEELLVNKYKLLGNISLNELDKDNIPPFFIQDIGNFRNCSLIFSNGERKKVFPADCVGLERLVIWDYSSFMGRIEDRIVGKKNVYEETYKVILNEDDIRNTPNPNLLRWDFVKEEFYLWQG